MANSLFRNFANFLSGFGKAKTNSSAASSASESYEDLPPTFEEAIYHLSRYEGVYFTRRKGEKVPVSFCWQELLPQP